ncbi:MAG: hypothetical protein EA363_07915 [Balneolaceae bacterium]|nr:MAG: hypothetical protein EA363_07915 [Balneolaceae bacterium]
MRDADHEPVFPMFRYSPDQEHISGEDTAGAFQALWNRFLVDGFVRLAVKMVCDTINQNL